MNQIKAGILTAAFASALFLHGCSGNTSEKRSKPSTSTTAADTSFIKFFQKFATDSVFQAAHLADSVKWIESEMSMDEKEDSETITNFTPNTWKYLDLRYDSSEQYKKQDAYKPFVERPATGRVDYIFGGIDNGIYINFRFRLANGTWELFEVRDDSN